MKHLSTNSHNPAAYAPSPAETAESLRPEAAADPPGRAVPTPPLTSPPSRKQPRPNPEPEAPQRPRWIPSRSVSEEVKAKRDSAEPPRRPTESVQVYTDETRCRSSGPPGADHHQRRVHRLTVFVWYNAQKLSTQQFDLQKQQVDAEIGGRALELLRRPPGRR